jgi:hypothetical protein
MEQAGRPVPDSYKNAPDLNVLTIPYWKAFSELTTSRDMGFGIGYIKYSEDTKQGDKFDWCSFRVYNNGPGNRRV